MDYNQRRKPELTEYEGKLKRLEQNMRGLSYQNDTDDIQQQDNLERRLLKIEERLTKSVLQNIIITQQDQRNDEYEKKLRKISDRLLNEKDYSLQIANEKIKQGLLIVLEDKFKQFQISIENKVEELFNGISERFQQHENSQKQLQKNMQSLILQSSDSDQVKPLFEMIKKSIDNQQQLVDEFKLLKTHMKQEIKILKQAQDDRTAAFTSTSLMEQENRLPIPISQSCHQRVFSTGKIASNTTQKKEFFNHQLESDRLQTTESARSKNKAAYNELKEQHFEQMRKISIEKSINNPNDLSWDKKSQQSKPYEYQRLQLAKQQIDDEINLRLLKEETERKNQIEKDRAQIRKSNERIQSSKSRQKQNKYS